MELAKVADFERISSSHMAKNWPYKRNVESPSSTEKSNIGPSAKHIYKELQQVEAIYKRLIHSKAFSEGDDAKVKRKRTFSNYSVTELQNMLWYGKRNGDSLSDLWYFGRGVLPFYRKKPWMKSIA